ncbi:MAG: T9SS type A sorting domain-containing protein [Ignavibacteria bacterium]|nr:T9SS type A sorting domain-containing protein [Ignavibacteria bacterium]
MKKKDFLKLFLFPALLFCISATLSQSIHAQSGWFYQNSGTNFALNDVYFINENTGWIAGYSIVLKTTNGGLNWISQTLPEQTNNTGIYFLNENTGFITGDISQIYQSYLYLFKTTNGGINWNTINYYITSGFFGTASSKDIYAVNDNTILKTYRENDSYTSAGSIMKSTNGGTNFFHTIVCGFTIGLSFTDSQTGWTTSTNFSASPIGGIFKIYKTTNTGDNWNELFNDTQTGNLPIEGRAIQFLNSSTGYILGQGSNTIFIKTTNGGINWLLDTLYHNKNRTMYFTDVNTGWIAGTSYGSNSNISKTTNGGINWADQNIQGTESINKIFFINSNTGWAVCSNGIILKTTTGGITNIQFTNTEIPKHHSLYQNYPNPFNSITNVKFKMLNSGFAEIKVYDITGKLIKVLTSKKYEAGEHTVRFDAAGLPSGVYFYRLTAGEYYAVKKMVLIR